MADPFIGEIKIFAGTFAPRDYAFCDGQLLQIAQFTALFATIGTTYGGDGRTTFALPNLQGRAPMHWGSGPGLTPRVIGSRGGALEATLNESQIPAHNHLLQASSDDRNSSDPAGKVLATTAEDYYADPPTETAQQMALQALDTVGGGQPHANVQPFQVLNYIIALTGTFPSRN